MWWSLAAIAGVSLFLFDGRNAVGGGGTLGAIVGIFWGLFRPAFEWSFVGKAMVIGALIGLFFELLPRAVRHFLK